MQSSEARHASREWSGITSKLTDLNGIGNALTMAGTRGACFGKSITGADNHNCLDIIGSKQVNKHGVYRLFTCLLVFLSTLSSFILSSSSFLYANSLPLRTKNSRSTQVTRVRLHRDRTRSEEHTSELQ